MTQIIFPTGDTVSAGEQCQIVLQRQQIKRNEKGGERCADDWMDVYYMNRTAASQLVANRTAVEREFVLAQNRHKAHKLSKY